MDRSRPPSRYGLPPGPPQPQQPSYDPFQRRDPFLPGPHQEKRDEPLQSPSYRPGDGLGSLPRPMDFASKDSMQSSQPPPPLSASRPSFNSNSPAYRDEHYRRRSFGSGLPGVPRPPSSIPPPSVRPLHSLSTPYEPRHFGATLSPPLQNSGSSYAAGPPLAHQMSPASSHSVPPHPAPRPSTSMSISSIMGSDRPPRPAPTQPPPNPSPTYSNPSPSWARSPLAAVPDMSRRPRTPDAYPSARDPYRPSGVASPDHQRSRAMRPPFSAASPPSSSMPPRPYSQPAVPDNESRNPRDAPREELFSPRARGFDAARSPERAQFDRGSAEGPAINVPRPLATGRDWPPGRQGFEDRWREHDRQTYADPRRDPSGSLARPEHADPRSRDPNRGPRTPSKSFEILNRDEVRPSAGTEPPLANTQEQASGSTGADGRHEPLSREKGGRSTPRSAAVEQQLRRSIEDAQGFGPRNAFNADYMRRPDRGSPLPQAVQGVSAQPMGIGRDPGIKSEFTRIFSGLGSGVGSTPVPLPPNGTGTPGRATPSNKDERDAESHAGAGASTTGNKRVRKVFEVGYDSESGDGQGSPAAGRAGTKRSKQTPTSHHHHHLPHTHHHHHSHHHHHAKPGAEPPAPLHRRSSNTPLSNLKHGTSPSTQPNGAAASPPSLAAHHHHHHQPHHHHHHHAPPALPRAPSPVPIPRVQTIIKTSPLLRSVAHIPRKHLGNQLYQPTVGPLSLSQPTPVDPREAVSSKPNVIPRFDGKENSTYTIRIPRTYLTEAHRLTLCRDRRVWGTDVYTDDSDPLTAAIHSGWILGAWPKDVDVSLLDLTINNASVLAATEQKLRRELVSSPPKDGPLTPPPERDCHLTLLILPPLKKYTSSVWHSVKSRAWGDNHDGMSFKIESLEWVDEGVVGRMRGRDAKSWKAGINSGKGDVVVEKNSRDNSNGVLGSRAVNRVSGAGPLKTSRVGRVAG